MTTAEWVKTVFDEFLRTGYSRTLMSSPVATNVVLAVVVLCVVSCVLVMLRGGKKRRIRRRR